MSDIDFGYLSPRNKKYQRRSIQVANGATFLTLLMSGAEKRKAANILYMHVQRVTRKCYVGITIMSAADRWGAGVSYRNNRRFGNAIKKYGWDAFDSYVIAFAEHRDALNSAEVAAIAAAGGHKSKFTYNLSPGGDLVAENDKAVVGVNLSSGGARHFKSGTDAARQLGMKNVDMPMAVARGERTSVDGWWFRFSDDKLRLPPESWGEELRLAAVRQKQGKAIVAINYATREQRTYDTTAAAAKGTGVHQSAVSTIARGGDYSANGWWFGCSIGLISGWNHAIKSTAFRRSNPF